MNYFALIVPSWKANCPLVEITLGPHYTNKPSHFVVFCSQGPFPAFSIYIPENSNQ